jgi:hypothetical protein
MEIRNNWNRNGGLSRTNGGKKDGLAWRQPGRSGPKGGGASGAFPDRRVRRSRRSDIIARLPTGHRDPPSPPRDHAPARTVPAIKASPFATFLPGRPL